MAILFKKLPKDIRAQKAVSFKKDLPKDNNEINDVRFVKSEHLFYIFNGYDWQEIDLIME
jgi:hypothetical protein